MPGTPANVKKPQDHLRAEVDDSPVTFGWDGEDWTVVPSDATGLEFLSALEDTQIITALRLLLGRDQASRLAKGRKLDDLEGFFEALGEAVGSGNL